MWTLIILGIIFLGWYIMAPQGEAGAAAEAPAPEPSAPPAPEPPPPPSASNDGSEQDAFKAPGS